MKPKGFLHRHANRENVSTAGKSMRYVGLIIIFCSLIFMLFNLEDADTWLYVWLICMIAGIVLVYMSFIFRKRTNKRDEDSSE